jgi:alanyl-tRNA synthetase
MKGSEIREKFLSYFESKGHRRVRSSSLVPQSDPTLLFTNAGMVQFKNVFTGDEKRDYVRAVTSQKCLRVSGKHNDLENVGVTARHHTFFEMLGNFSFGDYFKKDAITFGWDFLTTVMKLPTEKLWVTVYKEDDEAYDLWKDMINVPTDRIVRMGEKDNFWAMGETGPCGPCSEIIIDQGEAMACGPNCGIGMCDCDRYLELWNLVFMQFDRDESGKMTPLPRPSIDTGMGLERIAAVVQGKHSNYDCDLFTPIIKAIGEIADRAYGADHKHDVSMRAVADHSRAAAFLIADGVIPSNEGRGYVLRRIMRRALRHGKLLGVSDPFLFKVCDVVVDEMAPFFAELKERRTFIAQVVKSEEEKFIETLDKGLALLVEEIATLKKKGKKVLPGDVTFKLYDTFGFPLDLTQDIIKDEGITVDTAGFEAAMEVQRDKSKAAWKGTGDEKAAEVYLKLAGRGVSSTFEGYEKTTLTSTVTAIIAGDKATDGARAGDKVEVVTAATPFYGEMGGQVGDVGTITGDVGLLVEIIDATRPTDGIIAHKGVVKKGALKVGERVTLSVDETKRNMTEANHSATHLLHTALRRVLGEHVKQAGSLVSPDRLRFDYSHFGQVKKGELEKVEDIVNDEIRRDREVIARELSYDQAIKEGAIALFGEKYGDVVRAVKIPGVSTELCGGTHTDRTGKIGVFKIVHEGSIASGVRRIEAVTGVGALSHFRREEAILSEITEALKTTPEDAPSKIEKLSSQIKTLTREIDRIKSGGGGVTVDTVIKRAKEKSGIFIVSEVIPDMDPKSLRDFSDKIRDRMKKAVIALGSVADGKAVLLVAVTKDIADRYHAGEIIKGMAEVVGGKGGGRPDLAQAGGPEGEKIEEALKKVFGLIS